ncbi:MAG: PfkB family carbohydrate kinase, partial [Desulfobulbales bacterium]|nr:PfkB family carbohydrate kinase [Desulfobulbales bacterium]
MASDSDNPLIFGEVLFDCFPDGREELGGAPFNVAWNLQALGLSPVLISRVGNDVRGRLILDMAASWGMDSAGLQIDELYPTGKVQIELAQGEPSFTILPDQAYDHIVEPEIAHHRPAFLYHGSLVLRNETSRSTLNTLKHKLRCPIFLDVNLRNPWWDVRQVKALVHAATWLKLHDSELDTLFPGREKMAARCR